MGAVGSYCCFLGLGLFKKSRNRESVGARRLFIANFELSSLNFLIKFTVYNVLEVLQLLSYWPHYFDSKFFWHIYILKFGFTLLLHVT